MAGLGSGRAVQRMNYAKLSKQAIVGGGGHTKAQNGLRGRGGVLYFFGLCALSFLVRTLVLADWKDPGRRIKERLLDEEEGSELMERRMLLMQTKNYFD